MSDFPVVVKLEQIGDDQRWAAGKGSARARSQRPPGPPRPRSYVAYIVWDGYNIEKHFIQGQKDYSKANSVGSRGVYTYYILKSGGFIYEIHEHLTWTRSRTYWCRVEDGKIIEMSFEEALSWVLKKPSE